MTEKNLKLRVESVYGGGVWVRGGDCTLITLLRFPIQTNLGKFTKVFSTQPN